MFFAVNPSPSSRAREIVELAIGYGLILITVWTRNPEQRFFYWSAFAWIAMTGWLSRKRSRPIGLGLQGLARSLWVVAVATALLFLGLGIAARVHSLHKLYGPLPFGVHIFEYSLWALMQQYILQVYVLLRLLRLGMGRTSAVALATVLFAIVHIPNPVLVPAVVLWGAVSCLLYLRCRNLYPLAIAHGMLGMCLAVSVPNSLHHHMRVGIGYLDYPGHRSGLNVTGR
ncbi:MAG TPA: CPBP family intramembrane glutamic endopeptidase [Acidobacteriaceae bacterium]|nr:CPBP family intramembrane glutamic endopeptidase [Acidobacteriaceae bacterium]